MTNFYVDASRPDDSGNGLSWATAKKTIGAAYTLVTAGAGDVINVAAGTYTPAVLTITKANMTIQGPNALIDPVTNLGGRVAEAILSAATFFVDASDIQILGFKWDGSNPGSGMAISTSNDANNRSNCVVRNNIVVAGTGIMTWGIYPALSGALINWIVEQNLVGPWSNANGTGIWLNSGSVNRSSGCIIRNNKVDCPLATNSRGINLGDNNDGVIVENNWVNTNFWCIQSAFKNRNVIIRGNTVQGTATTGSSLIQAFADTSGVAENITIEDNICLNTQRLGIVVYPGLGYYKGDVIVRNNQIDWTPANLLLAFAAIDIRIYGAVTGSPACNVTIQNNVVSFLSGYTGVVTSSYGIKLRGDKITTANISGNTVNGGGFVSTEAVVPKPSGIFLSSNNSAAGVMSGVVTIGNNTFIGLDNGIVAFNEVTNVYGGLANTVTANGASFSLSQSLTYAVRNALPGNSIDARNTWWGHGSGPSGGALDPVTSVPANGHGVAISANVRFDPWIMTGVFVPPTEPIERSDSFGVPGPIAPSSGVPGTETGNTQFMQAMTEGQLPMYQNGRTVYEQAAPGTWLQYPSRTGNAALNGKNCGVGFAYNDNIGRFDNPGKAR